MAERVIFEGGDPDYDVDKQQRDEARSRRGRQLITIGGLLLGVGLLMILIYILLVTNAIPVYNKVKPPDEDQTTITKDLFGDWNERTIERYTLTNVHNCIVQIITYGARVTTIKVPDRHGSIANVVLGLDTVNYYEKTYLGGVLGRVANRIENATFTIDNKTYQVSRNDGRNSLNGGIAGWDKFVWNATIVGSSVVMSRISDSGEGGFPGRVEVNVTFRITDDNELLISHSARNFGEATPIDLSNEIIFNLAGDVSKTIRNHNVMINSNRYATLNQNHIPTGAFTYINNLRATKSISDLMSSVGEDEQHFCLNGPSGDRLAARFHDPESGRTLTVYTNQPGILFNPGRQLNAIQMGPNGQSFPQFSGFTARTQNYPDSVNHVNFPDSVLREGSTYIHNVRFLFSVSDMLI